MYKVTTYIYFATSYIYVVPYILQFDPFGTP